MCVVEMALDPSAVVLVDDADLGELRLWDLIHSPTLGPPHTDGVVWSRVAATDSEDRSS